MMTLHKIDLITGTLDLVPGLDGWVITSHIALAIGAEDVPLRRGDRITVDGDVYRDGERIANIA